MHDFLLERTNCQTLHEAEALNRLAILKERHFSLNEPDLILIDNPQLSTVGSFPDLLNKSLLNLRPKGRLFFCLRNKKAYSIFEKLALLLCRDNRFTIVQFLAYAKALRSDKSVYGDDVFKKMGIDDEVIFDLNQLRELIFFSDAKITFAKGINTTRETLLGKFLKPFLGLAIDPIWLSDHILIEVQKN